MSRRIEILQSIVDDSGLNYLCSLSDNTPKEERICLRQAEDGWTVFFVEKGKIFEQTHFKDENEACLKVIKELFQNPTERKNSISKFYGLLMEDSDEQIRKSTLKELISKVASNVACL